MLEIKKFLVKKKLLLKMICYLLLVMCGVCGLILSERHLEISSIDETSPALLTSKKFLNEYGQGRTSVQSRIADAEQIQLSVTDSAHFKIICYYAEWAAFRPHAGAFRPEHINHSLCTHIIFGSAALDPVRLTIESRIPSLDYEQDFYGKITKFKEKGVKVLLSLGGRGNFGGNYYSNMVHSSYSRQHFIQHVINFIKKYNFDGLDLDWKFPVCWKSNCNGPATDKNGFAYLIRELREQLTLQKLILSASVAATPLIIDKAYDVPTLAQYLDWIAIIIADFPRRWNQQTRHISPLYHDENEEFNYMNFNYSVNYWISKGMPSRKIVMGLPFYGQSYYITNINTGNGLNSPGSIGTSGEFTKTHGLLAYYEICDRIEHRAWTVVQDPLQRSGPYAYKNSQWVSFDDANMIKIKGEFVKQMDLAGAMVWSVDLDDFRGLCGKKYPLMNALNSALGGELKKSDLLNSSVLNSNEILSITKNKSVSTELFKNTKHENTYDYKIVCYFTNWAANRSKEMNFYPENIDNNLCTHIIYGFAILNEQNFNILPMNYQFDIMQSFYERVIKFNSKGIKILIAVRRQRVAGNNGNKLLKSDYFRKLFIKNVVKFIEKYGFDGLDLEWYYPKCAKTYCEIDPDFYKSKFISLVEELSAIFKQKKFLLITTLSPNNQGIDNDVDTKILFQYFDWITVQPYQFHKQFNRHTGHVSPLYKYPTLTDAKYNTNYTINYWMGKGIPPRKILLGIPFYGQSFTLANISKNGLNAPAYKFGKAGEFTKTPGILAYYEICRDILKNSWTVVHDEYHRIGPYAYFYDQWVGFDDSQQLKHKAEFTKKNNLGGVVVWSLDLDDFNNVCGCGTNPLLKTIVFILKNNSDFRMCSILGSNNTDQHIICEDKNIHKKNKSMESEFLSKNESKLHNQCTNGLSMPHHSQNNSIVREENNNKKIICYFTNWSANRSGKGKFLPESINSSLCTHIIYAFIHLNYDDLTIKILDYANDIEKNFYKRITSLKLKGIIISVALGIKHDTKAGKDYQLIENNSTRNKIVKNLLDFIEKYNFDGLDIVWEFPLCSSTPKKCSFKTFPSKQILTIFLSELYAELKSRKLLLSAAVSSDRRIIDHIYDVPMMSKYLDWISVMTFNMHGHWEQKVGHLAPLYCQLDDDRNYTNVNFSMHYWMVKGGNASKLVMGLPMFGQSFTMTNDLKKNVNSSVLAISPGRLGSYTKLPGFLAFYEICQQVISDNWNDLKDSVKHSLIGSYVIFRDQWIGYDDVTNIIEKTKLIRELNLSGGMIWALDLDDFNGDCRCGKYPLLTALHNGLRGFNYSFENCI